MEEKSEAEPFEQMNIGQGMMNDEIRRGGEQMNIEQGIMNDEGNGE